MGGRRRPPIEGQVTRSDASTTKIGPRPLPRRRVALPHRHGGSLPGALRPPVLALSTLPDDQSLALSMVVAHGARGTGAVTFRP